MVALPRKTQKTFAASAGTNERGVIGSFAAGSPAYSDDVETIQSLPNYAAGWYGVVVGQNSPAIQDMNSLDFMITRQLTYLFERGVPEYDIATTYYTGCLVSSAGILYVSLTNNNLGNALTDTVNWFTPKFRGLRTENTVNTSTTLIANETITWPNMAIGNGVTVEVPNDASLIAPSKIVVSGTGVLIASGTGVIRSL